MEKFLAIGNALMDVYVLLDNDSTLAELGLVKGDMTLIDSDKAAELEARFTDKNSKICTGGSAANTAMALAMVRRGSFFIGQLGRDMMGYNYKRWQFLAGVTSLAGADDGVRTGVAYTFISPDGERTFATHLGAAGQLQLHHIFPDIFQVFHTLYVEGYLLQNHELMIGIMQEAEKVGCDVALDLSSANLVLRERDFMRHILTDYVDIVFANRDEALAYAFGGGSLDGVDDPVHTAATILGRTCRTAVVKLGAEGALCIHEGREYRCPAAPVERVVDTTGAGDFFAGGFLAKYIDGFDPQVCLEMGATTASLIIQVVGTDLRHLRDDMLKEL